MAPGAHPRTQRLIEVRARKCMCMSVDRVDGFSDDEDSRTQKEDAHRVCSISGTGTVAKTLQSGT